MALAAFRVLRWELDNKWYSKRGENSILAALSLFDRPFAHFYALISIFPYYILGSWFDERAGTDEEESATEERLLVSRDSEELAVLIEQESKRTRSVIEVGQENVEGGGENKRFREISVQIFAVSFVVSCLVKYGELFFDAPFDTDTSRISINAAACIAIPTLINIFKWSLRSRDTRSTFGNVF
jgi:hypothetical protein